MPLRKVLAAIIAIACMAMACRQSATAQDAAAWTRGESGAVEFADLQLDGRGRFTLFCRMMSTGPRAGLSITAPAFQTLVVNRQEYSLTIVVDGIRENFHMVARDIELWFEATDLNQQTHLARFFDTLPTAQRIDFAISSLGWRENRTIGNGGELLGLLDNCL